jgi:hypothetical protein
MEINFSKTSTAIAITVVGLALLIFGIAGDQNSWFLMASGAILIVGVFGVLGGSNMFTQTTRYAVIGVMVVIWVVLGALDYKSIKDPIDFRAAKKVRFDETVQRLKDLRQVQMVFKNQKNVYAGDAKTLVDFVKYDSVKVIKANGFVPDSLTEERALELGIITRDTIYEPALSSIFNEEYLKERKAKYILQPDSLGIIPNSGGQMFDFEAGTIERNNLIVQVFQVTAAREKVLKGLNKRLITLEKDLKVGSMTDPTTSGNWGE